MPNIDKRGFNLLELMLATAMVVLITGIVAPVAGNLYNRNNLDLAAKQAVQIMRRAQMLAQASSGDSAWGIYFNGYQSSIFKGMTYASRDTGYDEDNDLPGKASASGLTEITFDKGTGLPGTSGTTTITLNNETKNIFINAKGTIEY